MDNEQYYSIEEVSKMLKVAYMTVYRWIRAKKLTAYKAGKQYRVKIFPILDWTLGTKDLTSAC